MEHSSNGDPRGDIIARGIVSEEQARMMYERCVLQLQGLLREDKSLTVSKIHCGQQEFPTII